MLKAVFFDAVGTLIYLPRSVGTHYQEVAAEFGANLSANELNAAFRRAWANAPARERVVGPRVDDDKGWWRGLVANVLQQTLTGREADSFDADGFFDTVYAHFALPGVWQAFDDVQPALQHLRSRNLQLGVISNFDRRLHKILEELDLENCFDVVIISSEVGADKPDRSIFQSALASLHVEGSEAIHVGDDPEKDGGATVVGMQVFCLHRPERGLLQFQQVIGEAANR